VDNLSEIHNRRKIPDRRVPKGILIAIGGNEDKKNDKSIFTEMLSLIKKQTKRIEIITTASQYPDEAGQEYYNVFNKDNDHLVGVMNILSREEASDESLLKRINETDIIFFTGGDQLRITSILGGSPLEKEMLRKYKDDFCIIAGSSAGASAMSKTMICGGDSREALLKGRIKISTGIGFIDNAIIDTHFVERGRFTRLMQLISMNPSNIGIGLGEDAGIIIEKGSILRSIGKGITVIVDGNNLKHTNIGRINVDDAIAIENLVIHTIVNGYGYDITNRKYLKPEDIQEFNKIKSEGESNENS